jgi:protoporphyrinogen oxidase
MLSCTRRELVAAFLGLPLLAACKPSGPREFAGGFAGPALALGHRLRDGWHPAPQLTRKLGTVIVGAGVAGLSAAWRLGLSGDDDFEVLELEAAAGGTSRSGVNAISAFPWGAHYLPCPLPHARAVRSLLLELGAASLDPAGELQYDEAQLVRAPQERLFVADRWYEGLFPFAGAQAADLTELARFEAEVARLAALRDRAGRRGFAVPLAAAGDFAELAALDTLSFEAWLDHHDYRSPRLRWWLEYGTRDDMCARLNQTSAFAGLHYHAARSGESGPANFLTWPEGNGRLIAHLAGRAGRRLRPGVVVTKLERRRESGWEVHTFEPASGRAEALQAEHVVAAIPDAVLSRLLDPSLGRRSLGESGMETGAWLVANLSLRSRPQTRGFPECWDNVLYGSRSLGYVVATHQTDSAERARSVWTWYLPLTGDVARSERQHLLALSFAECTELVIADLARAHSDIAQCIERIDVYRWAHAMPRPSPGMFSGALARARLAAQTSLAGLHFAHTELSGLALFEEAQWHGVRAAEEILGERGRLRESLL